MKNLAQSLYTKLQQSISEREARTTLVSFQQKGRTPEESRSIAIAARKAELCKSVKVFGKV